MRLSLDERRRRRLFRRMLLGWLRLPLPAVARLGLVQLLTDRLEYTIETMRAADKFDAFVKKFLAFRS